MTKPSVWDEAKAAYCAWTLEGLEYRCEYCRIQFQLESYLFQHIHEVHKVQRDKYTEDNPHYAVKTRGNVCLVCGEKVGNERRHLKSRHDGLSEEVYFMRFVFQDASGFSAEEVEEGKEGEEQLWLSVPTVVQIPSNTTKRAKKKRKASKISLHSKDHLETLD